MHTTSPTRAQRQDGTVPSVVDLMHQTQLQQVTRPDNQHILELVARCTLCGDHQCVAGGSRGALLQGYCSAARELLLCHAHESQGCSGLMSCLASDRSGATV